MNKEVDMNRFAGFVSGSSRRRSIVFGVAAMLLSWAPMSAWSSPILIINGSGNAESPFTNNSEGTLVTSGATVGGLGAAQVDFTARNQNVTYQSSGVRPLLDDNSVISAEIYVTQTEVTVAEASAAQGENRIRIIFRNPDGGAQQQQWVQGPGLGWFPDAETWTTFSYDLTQEAWWANDYSDWEVFRVILFENDDDPFINSFAIRNLQLTVPVPEPASMALVMLGGLLMVAKRRK